MKTVPTDQLQESDKALSQEQSTSNALGNTSRLSKAIYEAFDSANNCVSPEVHWQWEHRNGWRDYNERANVRIEGAFQGGYSFVRVKAGKQTTPMEIFFYDMLQHDPVTGRTRPIKRVGPDPINRKVKRKMNEVGKIMLAAHSAEPRRRMFAEYDRHRKEMLEEIDKKPYNVRDFYHDRGIFQLIAASRLFDNVGLAMVCLNIVWLGIDANHNQAASLYKADPIFIIFENVFTFFFLLEVLIRFGAFKLKRNCLRDPWFVFDCALVVLMIGETWVLPLAQELELFDASGSKGGWSVLRFARLLRVMRVMRMARVIRDIRELQTLTRGLFLALRSTLTTIAFLLCLLYIFGVIFKIQSSNNENLREIFPSVTQAMWVLGFRGILLDGPIDTVAAVKAESNALTVLFFAFIFVSAFTIVNMLIGIICNVVDQVVQEETDSTAVLYLKETLLDLLESHDDDDNRRIRRDEFELLMRNPEMHVILTRFGVDVGDLISLKDTLFDDKDAWNAIGKSADSQRDDLSFAEFLRVVLRLRGGNAVKVNDMVELREYMKHNWRTNFENTVKRIDTLEQNVLSRLPSMTPVAPREAWLEETSMVRPAREAPLNIEHVVEMLAEIRAGQEVAKTRQAQLEAQLVIHEDRAAARHDALDQRVLALGEQLQRLTTVLGCDAG